MRTKSEIETPKAVIRDTKGDEGSLGRQLSPGSVDLTVPAACSPAIDTFVFLNLFFFLKKSAD